MRQADINEGAKLGKNAAFSVELGEARRRVSLLKWEISSGK